MVAADEIWDWLATLLARPVVARWLIRRAQRTPYLHITSPDGKDVYMYRWWLFNPYPAKSDGGHRRWGDWLPSVRVHRIMRPDQDRHPHDHPWDARTIILAGGYLEERENGAICGRWAGATATLKFEEFHRITHVAAEGAWTLFITYRYRGSWGFKVGDRKVPWREYLAGRL